MAVIPGVVWHNEQKKGYYFTFIDADKLEAITEICTRNGKTISLQEMAEQFLIEQHHDSLDKAHIYFYSQIPLVKKSADTIIGLEVKGLGEHGIAYCSPSIHKDGQPYEIIGTADPVTLTTDQARELMQHIDDICKKHGADLSLTSTTKIYLIQNQRFIKEVGMILLLESRVVFCNNNNDRLFVDSTDNNRDHLNLSTEL